MLKILKRFCLVLPFLLLFTLTGCTNDTDLTKIYDEIVNSEYISYTYTTVLDSYYDLSDLRDTITTIEYKLNTEVKTSKDATYTKTEGTIDLLDSQITSSNESYVFKEEDYWVEYTVSNNIWDKKILSDLMEAKNVIPLEILKHIEWTSNTEGLSYYTLKGSLNLSDYNIEGSISGVEIKTAEVLVRFTKDYKIYDIVIDFRDSFSDAEAQVVDAYILLENFSFEPFTIEIPSVETIKESNSDTIIKTESNFIWNETYNRITLNNQTVILGQTTLKEFSLTQEQLVGPGETTSVYLDNQNMFCRILVKNTDSRSLKLEDCTIIGIENYFATLNDITFKGIFNSEDTMDTVIDKLGNPTRVNYQVDSVYLSWDISETNFLAVLFDSNSKIFAIYMEV